MVHEFRWRGADVLRLLDEARAAAQRRMTFDQLVEFHGLADSDPIEWSAVFDSPDHGPDVKPALHLVSNWGVALRSNAVLPPGAGRVVVYADGYGRDRHVDGSDFTEVLDAEGLIGIRPEDDLVILLDPDADTFQIRVDPAVRARRR